MTPTDPIYGVIAMAAIGGFGFTILAAWLWLYATEWLMEKFDVTDPLDKYYKNMFGSK